jgi:large subunit ribosomal protein L37Ae
MAKKAETFKGVKRFGARYGRRLRQKLGMIENVSRRLQKCPYCNFVKAKKVALGIFECRKCGAKFASRAYSPLKKKVAVKVQANDTPVEEEAVEETDEDFDEEENQIKSPAKKVASDDADDIDDLQEDDDIEDDEEQMKENGE